MGFINLFLAYKLRQKLLEFQCFLIIFSLVPSSYDRMYNPLSIHSTSEKSMLLAVFELHKATFSNYKQNEENDQKNCRRKNYIYKYQAIEILLNFRSIQQLHLKGFIF